MIRIVKGNPFCLRIKLTDISIDLTQATSLNLRFVSGVVTSYDLTPSISSPHVFEVRVKGDLAVGVYMIELVGKYGGDDFRAAYADAIGIVHTNQQADLAPTDALEVQTIDLTFEGAIAKGADGRSAYQVAVDNGYEGTETEWLASLKGERGEKGEQGQPGERGPQGAKGEQGEGITEKDRDVLDCFSIDELLLYILDKTFVADKALLGQVAAAELQTATIYGDEEHVLTVPNKSGTIATKEETPRDVSRTTTDIIFVGGSNQNLFRIRPATNKLAGSMTAADKAKLDAMAEDIATLILPKLRARAVAEKYRSNVGDSAAKWIEVKGAKQWADAGYTPMMFRRITGTDKYGPEDDFSYKWKRKGWRRWGRHETLVDSNGKISVAALNDDGEIIIPHTQDYAEWIGPLVYESEGRDGMRLVVKNGKHNKILVLRDTHGRYALNSSHAKLTYGLGFVKIDGTGHWELVSNIASIRFDVYYDAGLASGFHPENIVVSARGL